jgi:type IV pilus assembly protein PilC
MRYQFTATTPKGRIEKGAIEARTKAEAADQIRASGLLVVSLGRERSGFAGVLSAFEWTSPEARVTFAKHMSLMIRAGLPIDEAVRVLADQSKGRFRRDLLSVLKAVESGRSLADAFAEHPRTFSELTVAAVRAGEASGTLEENLDELAEQMTKNYELVRKIRGAMLYPAVVLVAALAVGISLSVFVLPRIIALFETITVTLPLGTRILLAFSRFVVAHGQAALLVGAVAALALYQLLRLKAVRPVTDTVILHLPVFGKLARNYNLAMFARAMATLLRSGMAIGDAFLVASNTLHSEPYKRALLKVREGTERGVPASSVIEEYPRLFPSIVSRMIAVGERTGKLEETYKYLAEFYEDEVDVTTKNLATLIEPVLLIVIGLAVAFIAISIISPIYSFIGSIQRL